MKVLLCSPYESEIKENAGGIAVWTKNIVDYYHAINPDGVDIEVLPYNRTIYVHDGLNRFVRAYKGVLDYLNLIRRTRKRIREEHFDVLHLSSSALWSIIRDYIVMRMARRHGVAGVIHFHCGRIPGLAAANNWRWRILKQVVKIANATIVLDETSHTVLSDRGYERVYKVPNPLSQDMCDKISQLAPTISRIPHRILFVGHVLPSKGAYELVRACASISDIEVRLLGRVEPQVEDDLRQIAAAKHTDWLHLLGEKPHEEVLEEMLACDLFVFPSYTEGFPNVIIEAMACHCPIVATSVGAIPEMLGVENGVEAGVLIAPKDVQAVNDAIVSLLDDEQRKRVMADAAVLRVKSNYAVASVWDELVHVWQSAVDKEKA